MLKVTLAAAFVFFLLGLYSAFSTYSEVKHLRADVDDRYSVFDPNTAAGATANATRQLSRTAGSQHNGVTWLACALLALVIHWLARIQLCASRIADALDRDGVYSR